MMLLRAKLTDIEGIEKSCHLPSSGFLAFEEASELKGPPEPYLLVVAEASFDDETQQYRCEVSRDRQCVRARGKQTGVAADDEARYN